MILRHARPDDAPAISALFHASVHEVGAHDYTPEQCAAWSPAPRPASAYVDWMSDGRVVLVAEDAGRVLGFIDLEADGHIDLFYCAPEAAGKSVGRALYGALEMLARKNGHARLYVEASEAARRFFLRAGFAELHRRDFERNGVAIHNFAMEKRL